MRGGWDNEGMAAQPGPTRAEREPGWAVVWRVRAPRLKGQTQKRVFVALLIGWNALWIGGVAYTLWMRHHSNVQPWQTSLGMTLEVSMLILGSLVIAGVSLIVRQIMRRVGHSTVE